MKLDIDNGRSDAKCFNFTMKEFLFYV